MFFVDYQHIFLGLVLCNFKFCSYVLFKIIIIPIQMVWSDIEYHGYIRPEGYYIIQLKTTQLQHIPFFGCQSNLSGKTVTDIAGNRYIQPCFLKNVIGEAGGRRLAIGSGDTHYLAVSFKPVGPFNLTYQLYTFLSYLLHYTGLFGNSRALNHNISSENLVRTMLPLFKCNAPLTELIFILLFDGSRIRNPYLVSL